MLGPIGAIIGGVSILSGLTGSRSSSSGRQSTRVTPYPRDASATMLWDTFMNRLLGDKLYPMLDFTYNGNPMQVSQASIIDALINKNQGDYLARLYNQQQGTDAAAALSDPNSSRRFYREHRGGGK